MVEVSRVDRRAQIKATGSVIEVSLIFRGFMKEGEQEFRETPQIHTYWG